MNGGECGRATSRQIPLFSILMQCEDHDPAPTLSLAKKNSTLGKTIEAIVSPCNVTLIDNGNPLHSLRLCVRPCQEIRPIVIAGPSGVGKGTLIGMLMKEYPNHFGFSVSHTTRSPRYDRSPFVWTHGMVVVRGGYGSGCIHSRYKNHTRC